MLTVFLLVNLIKNFTSAWIGDAAARTSYDAMINLILEFFTAVLKLNQLFK